MAGSPRPVAAERGTERSSESLQDAEHARLAGDADLAIRVANRSLRYGAPGLDWVQFALRCRDHGPSAAAETILTDVVRFAPCPAAYYELAFLHRLRGEHGQAVALLRIAHAPEDARVQTFLAHMLYAVGAHPEADAVLDQMTCVGPVERRDSDAMFAFGRYGAQHPLGRSLSMLNQVTNRHEWLEIGALADRVSAAVRDRRPFALIRLGDGEGGMLRLGQQDEFAYRPLYERNRDELVAMWFGDAFSWRTNGFLDLAADLLDELRPCDVVGIPYESWIRHEYAISSLRGIPSLVNVYRALLARHSSTTMAVCSQQAHLHLHTGGHLAPILATARRISVITCLREVGDLLRDRFGLEEVTVYQIPGEQGSRNLLGHDASRGTHYPDAFKKMQAELAHPHDGRLFLVAGGLLGKFYAATIRRHGGIALDIGSLVDAWTGRTTRPGYGDHLKL